MATEMSSALRKLIKKLSSVQSSVSSITNFTIKFNPASDSITQVTTRLRRLNNLMEQFSTIQVSIMELDEQHEELDKYIQFEDTYCTLKSNMEDIITKYKSGQPVSSLLSSQGVVGESMKLPIIQCTVFNGNLEDWASFFDTFNALFHNNCSLSNVQKLHYLKFSVSG